MNSAMPSFQSEPKRGRLLIADDDLAVRSVLSMTLNNAFAVVGAAADSEQAIELARKTRPDAALVDVQMPKGGGIRAVEGIVEASPATAIVMLSVDESDATVRKLLTAGAVAYCRKGTSASELVRSLVEAIQVRARERGDAPACG
jgi:DNA-binding NarL/FixJ family response regulator